jgi:S-adenosylmethionine-diacylglycerol 3-amino-3-carboxypropyl transferase
MKDFFSRLNYSFGNEDWKIERKALQIASGNHVLCITASGDRPLNLLMDECGTLTSLDANPVQNHLLSLKCAALQTLDHQEYIGFLGAQQKEDREKTFEKVLNRLPVEAANFWKKHPKMIQKGVLYQGQVERLTKLIAYVVDILRPKKVKRLFEIDNLEEQREFIKKEWDTFLLRKTFDVMLCRAISRLIDIDPGLYTSVDRSMSLGSYIYNRMLNSLNHTLAKENMIISLIFRGFVGEEAFPPYLTEKGAEVIQKGFQLFRFTRPM